MKKLLIAAVATATALTGMAPLSVAAAQPYSAYQRDSDRDGRPDAQEWNRDRDRDGRPDQYDRYDNRRDGDRYDRGGYGHRRGGEQHWRYYGGRYGYNGYQGSWRTGQYYPHWRERTYIVEDYRAYNLPPPRAGYRYYRDDNGDVVMAAIASGMIGLIIGGALNDNDHHRDRYGYGYRH